MARTILGTLTLAMALGGLGCGEELSLPELGSRQAAIVNGALDPGHPAVGILHSGNAAACTATLIGKRTVLTAAHCVTTENPPYTLLSPVHFYLGGFYGSKYVATSVKIHPSYAGGNVADLAVVRLSQEVSNVTPATIATSAPTLGELVELVGYGKTGEDEGEFGTKRRAQNSVGKLQSQIFTMYGASGSKGNLCNGDSGGPTFANRGGVELLIGIHSTKGGVCGQEGNDMRVDAFQSWIASEAQGDLWGGGQQDKAAPKVSILSPTSGAELGASFQVEVTASDDVAVTQVVLYIDGLKASTKSAAPYSFQLQNLTAGAHTIEAVGLDAAGHTGSASVAISVKTSAPAPTPNRPPAAPSGPALAEFGAACERSAQCAGGICALDHATGERFCTMTCDPGASACPGASTCTPVGATAVCAPSAPGAALDENGLAGGCQLARGGETGTLLPLALLALLVGLARRRARRTRAR